MPKGVYERGRKTTSLSSPKTLTPVELSAWRSRFDLPQAELGRLLGVNVITISRWERGVQKIPPYLTLAVEHLTFSLKEVRRGG